MDTKITTVQTIYQAFGQGDLPTVLDNVTDDVDWASEPDSITAPWHGVRHGKAELPSFFAALAESVEVLEFSPQAFTASDTDVMAVVRFAIKSKATGKSATMDLHHWWRFRDGKVCFYRGTEDTAATREILTS
jgi:ketosteroid isomerase-like protein